MSDDQTPPRSVSPEQYSEMADRMREATVMGLEANLSLNGVLEPGHGVDCGPFIQGALAGVAEFTAERTPPERREEVRASLQKFIGDFFDHAVAATALGTTEGTA